jgi:hypothetical protein
MSSGEWPKSPFRREVDRPADESDNTTVRRPRVLTLGRFLFVSEIYLFVATGVALSSDTFIAPPLLVFFMLHHWRLLVVTVTLICCCEFVWRRTWLTGVILFLTVIAAGVGYALQRAG